MKKKHRVVGRVKDVAIDGHDRKWVFELTRDGAVAREKCRRKDTARLIPFSMLAESCGITVTIGATRYTFTVTQVGVAVSARGEKTRTVTWTELANMGRPQPWLFPGLKETPQ